MIRALSTFRLLDGIMFRTPYSWEEINFFQSYRVHRITHEPLDGNCFLNGVRNVALQISLSVDAQKDDECITTNVVQTLCAMMRMSRDARDRWRSEFRRPNKWDPCELEKHIFGAALCTNSLSYVRRSTALRDAMLSDITSVDNSCVFGTFIELAAKLGNEELHEYLMASAPPDSGPGVRFELFKLAAIAGRIDIVRFLHGYRSEEWPWRFENTPVGSTNPLDSILDKVMDLQVWEYIETLRIACGMFPTSRIDLWRRIRHFAGLGYLDMVSFLIRVAAHTDEGRDRYSVCMSRLSDFEISCQWRNEAVDYASKRGFIPIVEILLDDGAESDRTLSSAAGHGHRSLLEWLLNRGLEIVDALVDVGTWNASRVVPAKLLANLKQGPYLDVVRLLLDAGVDVNESIGKDSPLAGAIATEHTALFEFLLERGADLHSPGTAEECVRRAKKHGLESMLMLLENHGVDVNVGLEEAV